MATTTSPAETQIVLEDEGYSKNDSLIKLERIEHFGGEVDFFISARDHRGDGPDLVLSVASAEALHAWLSSQLGR